MRWLALAALLAGCPKPLPAPIVVADAACPAGVTASQGELCVNAFTVDSLACVACSGAVPDGGCFLPGPAVRCVAACYDSQCRVKAGAK